jgi:uncharacterized membrane protein (DUF2068 family)
MRLTDGLRTVALLEAAKGAIVLLVGLGLFSLMHRDVQGFAERLVLHAHLNPAAHYPHIFLDLSRRITDTRLWQLALAAAGYSLVRFIEAYGLWHMRGWGQWFAALSGAVYIPFELVELVNRPNWLSVGALLLNAGIVAFMAYSLYREKLARSAGKR